MAQERQLSSNSILHTQLTRMWHPFQGLQSQAHTLADDLKSSCVLGEKKRSVVCSCVQNANDV